MGGKKVQSKSLSFLRTFPFLLPSLRTFELVFVCIFFAKKKSHSRVSPPLYLPHLAISCCRFRKKNKNQFCLFAFFCFFWVGFVFLADCRGGGRILQLPVPPCHSQVAS
jgi:hypothetical protein